MTNLIHTVPDQRIFWDRWHEHHAEASHVDHSEESVQNFINALPHKPGQVLEVGCGQGREAVQLALMGLHVNALDLSPVAISTAKSNALEAGAFVEFLEHDTATALPYESKTFTGAFAHLSLHYFDDVTTQEIFDELARVLEPGGILFFTVRSVHDSLYGSGERIGQDFFCLNGHLRHFFDHGYVRTLMSEWDVRLAECYNTNDRTVNPGSFIRVLAIRP